MKEWFVYFRRFGDGVDEDERVVHFTSFWKLLRWILLNLHDCYGVASVAWSKAASVAMRVGECVNEDT